MYLAELELQGFKSFANKTKVRFGNGITAIVGPNGCGKSNIVDALRWVLGEQRPSLLRSATMANVIFNGTASKKALGMAGVSVTINNSKGILPTEFSDVTITRRLYRSGESEYLMNNKPCRLRDIADLFIDTGMGSDAYSVIELNMVDNILNDKNSDRRKLFEEAAGISKFKERKKQTLKKLSDTRVDMQRMEDIMVEVRKKARSLQTQASRAERAGKYRNELEFLDKAVSWQESQNIRDELNPLLERIAGATSSKEELQRRLQILEQNEKQAHEVLREKEQSQNEISKKVTEIINRIQETRANIRIGKEKISNEEQVIARYEQDIHQAETDIRGLRNNLKSNQEELKNAESGLVSVRREREAAGESLEKNKSEVKTVRKQLEESNRRHSEMNNRINELQSRKIRLDSRVENASEQKQQLEKEINGSRDNMASSTQERDELREKRDTLASEFEQAEQQLETVRGEREQLMNRIDRKKDEIRSLKSRHDALQSEYRLLKNLSESSDAHPAGVQYLREHRNAFTRLEIVSDIFTSRENHSAAVEAVLGDAVNFVITANEEEAERAFNLLKKEDKGRVTIIPLNLISSDYPVVDLALHHEIGCAPDYNALKALFFGKVVLTKHLEKAVQTASERNVTTVTPAGDVVTEHGFIYSGSSNKDAGVRIGLREKIKNRLEESKKTARKVEKEECRLEDLNEQYRKFDVHDHQQKVKEASACLQKHESRINSLSTQIDFYKKTVCDLEKRLEEQSRSTQEAFEDSQRIVPELKELSTQMESIIREEVTLKSKLQEKEEVLQRSQTTFNDSALRCQNAENTVETLRRDIQRYESDVQTIKDQLQQRAEQATESKNLIFTLREQIESAEKELQELLVSEEKMENERRESEDSCSRQRGKINVIEEELKEVRHKKESNQELLHSLELARSRMEMDQKKVHDHLWETYSLTIDQIDERLPENIDISTAQESIFTLKERLKNIGEVNPLAIAEYEEEKERLSHFERQISDLQHAEDQLIETIQEINRNALDRFNKTFHQIRENFRTVFNTLFEENDHCDLVISEGNEDPLEAKIDIVANPRGKRPSVIEQLSGGEKTLTAIALLFAIYLVKPSPFCVMDEVDAPLDDPNILRFTKLLKKFSNETQFIVITHNKTTMEKSETMYGVTMPEMGVSKLVGVRLEEMAV